MPGIHTRKILPHTNWGWEAGECDLVKTTLFLDATLLIVQMGMSCSAGD